MSWTIIMRHNLPYTSHSVPGMLIECSRNVMAHGDAREGKRRWNWRMEWVASTLHTTSENGVSSITTADAHTSAASSRLNWRPRRFKWTRPFRRKTKSGFWACAITFQTQSTILAGWSDIRQFVFPPRSVMLIKDTLCIIQHCVLHVMLFTYIYRSIPQYVTTQQLS